MATSQEQKDLEAKAKQEEIRKQQQLVFKTKHKSLSDILDKYKGSITQALPKHINANTVIRTVLTEASKTPAILDCTMHSILSCVITSSQLGLRPGAILGECFFIPYNNTKNNTKECQLVIGYKGLNTLAYRTGMVMSVQARAVYAANSNTPEGEAGDLFEWELGLNETLKHIPGSIKSDDQITHFYAIVKFKNGGHVLDVMTREQINKIRDESANYKDALAKDERYKNKYSTEKTIWHKYFAEMGCKTVLRRMMKYVPLSPELTYAIGLDEAADYGGQKLAVEILQDPATPEEMRNAIEVEIIDEDNHDQNEYTDLIKANNKSKKDASLDELNALLSKEKKAGE